jgi:DNA repair exonuclease SbcCD nuclease subunit
MSERVPFVEIVVLADLHLKSTDHMGTGYGVENTRTKKKLEILQKAVDHASGFAAHQRYLVLAGDMFDSPRVDESIRFAFTRVLTSCSNGDVSPVRVVHVAGNHPRVGNVVPMASESLIAALSDFGYVLVTGPESWRVGCKGGWDLLFVPFSTDVGERLALATSGISLADDLVLKDHTVLFSHFPLAGWWQSMSMISDLGVDPNVLDPYRVAMLGDFHRRQWKQEDGKWHGYVGSAAAISFAESEYPHGFAVLRLFEWPDYEVEWVNSDDDPVLCITMGTKDHLPDDLVSNAIIKVVVRGPRSELAVFDVKGLLAHLYEKQAQFVKVETETTDEIRPTIASSSGFVSDPKELIREFSAGDKDREKVWLDVLETQQD